MKVKYFDIHSHIDFSAFDKDREEVIKRMRDESVRAIAVGTDLKTSKEVINLANKYDEVFATVGLHPDCDKGQTFVESDYNEFVKDKKVVAVGECGLDYFRLNENKNPQDSGEQKENFIKQIEFALENNLPLMLHFRSSANTMDAYENGLEILNFYKKEYGDKLRGNAHFFAGSLEIAKKFLDIGFTLSFTGVITFTESYNEVIKYIPLDMIMAETDCPFVAPLPHRGKRCEPIYVKEVVKKISEIKNEDYEKVRKTLVDNAFRVFFKL